MREKFTGHVFTAADRIKAGQNAAQARRDRRVIRQTQRLLSMLPTTVITDHHKRAYALGYVDGITHANNVRRYKEILNAKKTDGI